MSERRAPCDASDEPPCRCRTSVRSAPRRNGERRLAGAVASVLAQPYGRLELVISDNASTDGTEEICRGLAGADPRVRYHRQPENSA